MDKKDFKIEFAPGVLEDMEKHMTPAEMQEFMDELKAKLEDGSLFAESEPVDMETLEEEEPEVFDKLVEALDQHAAPRTLH